MLPNNFFNILSAPASWFTSLVEATGLTSFVMGSIIAALVSRFLLLPFFSGALSDGVREPISNTKRLNKQDLQRTFKYKRVNKGDLQKVFK